MRFGSAKALVFDFDGTLVDSNAIKWKAFEVCFDRFPAYREEILSYCQANNHTTRYEKFRWVYERILKLPYNPVVEEQLSRLFEEQSTRQIVEAPEIPGAAAFLKRRKGKQALVLLSSTPQPILLKILAGRGWESLFDEVRGAPVDKTAFLEEFLVRKSLRREEVLFFGDTSEDADAARRAGWSFVAVRPTKKELTEGEWVADLREGKDA